jgi:hypothetical protein
MRTLFLHPSITPEFLWAFNAGINGLLHPVVGYSTKRLDDFGYSTKRLDAFGYSTKRLDDFG